MRHAALPAALLALALPLAAAEPGQPGPFTYTLKPGQVAENCVKMASSQFREFDWTADAPVDFNIHWHDGDRVEYGVKIDHHWKGRGRFTAERDQDYCWMWTAPKNRGATVMGSFKAVK
jgi:hypothetical protein